MSDTLPAGWVGSDSRHHVDIAGLCLVVSKDGVGGRCWCLKSGTEIIQQHGGHETAALARADGLTAVEAFGRKIAEDAAKLRTETP